MTSFIAFAEDIEQKTLSKEDHHAIYRVLVDLVGDAKVKTQKLAAPFALSAKELQEQAKIKTLTEKLDLLLAAANAAEDALKARKEERFSLGDKDFDEKAARQIQRDLNKFLQEIYTKLVALAKQYKMTLQEFRDRLAEKEVVELFDYFIDAIELGQDGPKLQKEPLKFQSLESIPWRIKIDEADDLYYKIKPHEVEYYDAMEALHRRFNAMSDAEYKAKEAEYRRLQQELKDKLKDKIARYCEAFSQIDPYLKRRGQSCGEKCNPIPVCKVVGW